MFLLTIPSARYTDKAVGNNEALKMTRRSQPHGRDRVVKRAGSALHCRGLQISENTIQQSEIRSRPDKFRHGQEHS